MKNRVPQEKEYAGSILYMEKLEAMSLVSATMESACPKVRDHFRGLLMKSLDDQKGLLEIMNKKGWYNVQPAPREQVQRIHQSFTMMEQQAQQMQ